MESKLALRPKYDRPASQALDVDAARQQYIQLSDKELYNARGGGGKAPSARLAKQWGLHEGISCEVLEYGADDKKAWARVKAWKGSRENPHVVREDAVVLVYQDMLAAAIFEAIENGVTVTTGIDDDGRKTTRKVIPDWDIGEGGMPVLLDRNVQFSVMKTFAEKRKFAGRAAVSTAKRRIFLEMLEGDPEANEPDEHEKRGQGDRQPQGSTQGEFKKPSQNQAEDIRVPPTTELVRLRGLIGIEMMRRSDGNKERASVELFKLTTGMTEAKVLPGPYRFLSDILDIKLAESIVRLYETQDRTWKKFLEVAQGNGEEAGKDFRQVVDFLRTEDLEFPHVGLPIDLYRVEALEKILEMSEMSFEPQEGEI